MPTRDIVVIGVSADSERTLRELVWLLTARAVAAGPAGERGEP